MKLFNEESLLYFDLSIVSNMLKTAATTDPIAWTWRFDSMRGRTMNLQGFAFSKISTAIGVKEADLLPRKGPMDEHRNTFYSGNPPTIMS
jgi:hypothetical protein